MRQSWCSRTPDADDDGLALRPLSLPRPQCLPLPLTTIHPACATRVWSEEAGERQHETRWTWRWPCWHGRKTQEKERGREEGQAEGRTGGSGLGSARDRRGVASRLRSAHEVRRREREDGAAINRHGESKMSPSNVVRGCWLTSSRTILSVRLNRALPK